MATVAVVAVCWSYEIRKGGFAMLTQSRLTQRSARIPVSLFKRLGVFLSAQSVSMAVNHSYEQ